LAGRSDIETSKGQKHCRIRWFLPFIMEESQHRSLDRREKIFGWFLCISGKNGGPSEDRTPDPLIKSQWSGCTVRGIKIEIH